MLSRRKMDKKIMITLATLLATLMATSFMGGDQLVYAQEVDENMVAAESLLSMLTDSEAEVTSIFESIIGEGGEVPEEATDAYNDAQELHQEAQELFDEELYEESLEKATEALNKYGEAITIATPEPEEMTPLEEEIQVETDKLTGLFRAVANARDKLSKLDTIVMALESQGIEGTDVTPLFEEIENELVAFEADLNNPEIDKSTLNFGQVNSKITHLINEIRKMGKPIKTQKFENFQLQYTQRVSQLEKKMNKILAKMGSSEENMLMLQSQFGQINEQIEGIDTDDFKEAVKELKKWVKETKKVSKNKEIEEQIGEDGLESINEQIEIEIKLQYYMGLLDEMEDDDPMKAEILDLITIIQGLIDDAETALVDEDEGLADSKMTEAKDKLDELDDLMGNGKGKNKGKPEKEPKVKKVKEDKDKDKEDKDKDKS
jgi:hypothetical protein